MDISTDPLLQEFFQNRGQKERTREGYHYSLTLYHESTGLTPTMMIEEAEDDEDQNIRLRRRQIVKHLNTFHLHLEEKCYTPDSVKKHLTFIRTFYRHFNIQLPNKPKIRKDRTVKKLPELDDIKLAITRSNLCFQSIIVLMASSAMGRSEISNLTVNDFLDAISKYAKVPLNSLTSIGEVRSKLEEKQVGPLIWKIRRVKTDHPYVTFSTPESLEFILRYLESKPAPQSTDDKLFLNKWNKPFQGKVFNQYFRDLNRRCGWGMEGKQIFFRSHNLRKFFARQLENTSLGYLNTRRLMGHVVMDDTGRRYFKADEDYLYHEYYVNMDRVSIFSRETVHDSSPEKMAAMEEQMISMQRELDLIKRQREAEELLKKM
jgi:integrase